MASRHAEKQYRYRQRRYRQRLQERGLVHVQGWVTPAQAEAIRRLLTARNGEFPDEELRGRAREARSSADPDPT